MKSVSTRASGRATPNMVHLGLGSFHRSHQAWYTQLANQKGGSWSYKSFAVNSTKLASAMSLQNCIYSLVETRGDGFEVSKIESISEVGISSNQEEFSQSIAAVETQVVTLTISESGYDNVVENSALLRLYRGLKQRFDESAAPLTVISCDNIPENGNRTRESLMAFATKSDGLLEWLENKVRFPNTMVDRITPKPETWLSDLVLEKSGFKDHIPVLTEPYSEWFISGEFAAQRPEWEAGGAKFVEDLTEYENRKLWLLNGSHSFLAYSGLASGHKTVDQVMNDNRLRPHVEGIWQEVSGILQSGKELEQYVELLASRFSNPHIGHQLNKIAQDGPSKLRTRCIPAIERRFEVLGLTSPRLALEIAAWMAYLEIADPKHLDQESRSIQAGVQGNSESRARFVLEKLKLGLSETSGVLSSLIEAGQILRKDL